MTGHYLFEPEFCNVASGWEKGIVEKNVDGYVEQPARVTTTALIHFQRNRYSVPCEWVNAVVSLRAYASKLRLIGPGGAAVELTRSFDRDQTFYDWQHYIGLLERKPGALRNGAPFKEMPGPLQELQRQLLKNPGVGLPSICHFCTFIWHQVDGPDV
jgi:hypothetical protein